MSDTQDVPENPHRTGVCVVRVHGQGGGLLITVRFNPDIENVTLERVRQFSDIGKAVAEIHTFLSEFGAAGPST